MRNFLIALLIVTIGGGIALSAVAPASAQSVGDIQAQIRELLTKVAELTRQLNLLQGSGPNSSSATVMLVDPMMPPAKHRICTLLARNLVRGSEGDDVMGLQEFLREQGYLSANATGYFGPLTAEAVARWQAAEGVQAVGVLGPISRERIKVWCGGWQDKERFSASPTRGEAPLTVTFSTWLSGFRPRSIHYTVDFGDGTSERAADCYAPADRCERPGENKHTYQKEGTYTATLNKITDPCPDDGDPNTPRCMAPVQSEVVAKEQVYVGKVVCTKEYKPVCGQRQVQCITTPCNPVQETYGNRCMMEADGATFLHEGACRGEGYDPAKDPKCKSWYDGCNSCSRETPNSPAMCTLRACTAESMTKPYCTAYFESAGNRPPTISSFSGPTTLAIDQTGTWTIRASDPENGNLTYAIDWGDKVRVPSAALSTSETIFLQTTTFTHSYAASGEYKILLTVRDDAGKEAKTSTTVRVGRAEPVACTMDAMQCPDGTWVGRTGSNCQFICPN